MLRNARHCLGEDNEVDVSDDQKVDIAAPVLRSGGIGAENERALDSAQWSQGGRDLTLHGPGLHRDAPQFLEERTRWVRPVKELTAGFLGSHDLRPGELAKLAPDGLRRESRSPCNVADVEGAIRLREQQADNRFAGLAKKQCSERERRGGHGHLSVNV